ncbi:MAG: glycine cleavage system protein GcvH [Polaromonas sp.]|nr:glycine cleavage system protein GcvH [Polaromonas sp.]
MMKYTEDHEWVSIEGDIATVGITVHAQDALGDVVFVDLPAVGSRFAQKETAGVVESVKAAADVYMPLSGEVLEVNEALRSDPSLANTDPMGTGWFFRLRMSDTAQLAALLDETAYAKFSNA